MGEIFFYEIKTHQTSKILSYIVSCLTLNERRGEKERKIVIKFDTLNMNIYIYIYINAQQKSFYSAIVVAKQHRCDISWYFLNIQCFNDDFYAYTF